jgi:hypothetical protein
MSTLQSRINQAYKAKADPHYMEGAGAYNERKRTEQAARVREDSLALDAHRRARDMEKLKQSGTLAEIDRTQVGETKRQGMSEAGANTRAGMTESGLNNRILYSNDLATRAQKFGEFSAMNGLGKAADEYGAPGESRSPSALTSGFNDYLSGRDPKMEAGIAAYRMKNKGLADDKIDFPQPMIDYMQTQSQKEQQQMASGPIAQQPGQRSSSASVKVYGREPRTLNFDSSGYQIKTPTAIPVNSASGSRGIASGSQAPNISDNDPGSRTSRLGRAQPDVEQKKKPLYGDQWSRFKNFFNTPNRAYNNTVGRPWKQY